MAGKRLMNSEKIIAWLKEHPLINRSGLEKLCEMPVNSIHRAVRGLENISPKYHDKIAIELRKYGFIH